MYSSRYYNDNGIMSLLVINPFSLLLVTDPCGAIWLQQQELSVSPVLVAPLYTPNILIVTL